MAECDVPSDSPAHAGTPAGPWIVFFAVIVAPLCAWDWATAHAERPLASVLVDQARGFGILLIGFTLVGVLAWKNPLRELRWVLTLAPFYLVALVPNITWATAGWEGGWALGTLGAAAGAAAGAGAGWLFARLIMPDLDIHREPARAFPIPVAFAVLIALLGAYHWASAWPSTLNEAWALGLFPLVFAFLGALVGKPLLSMVSALPVALMETVPLVGWLTVGWEGGWPFGIAGAIAGAAAGAANGWLYDRWIMPEYKKRRERERGAGAKACPSETPAS